MFKYLGYNEYTGFQKLRELSCHSLLVVPYAPALDVNRYKPPTETETDEGRLR